MQKIWLWTVLGFNSDVSASVKSSQKIKGIIVEKVKVKNVVDG